MLMKWIKCQVNEENKRSFSKAQEGWGQLRHCAGFIGQIGGWNRNEPCEAGILSVWKDLHCYQRFMQHHHDEIFAKSDQGSTYTNISVDIFESISNIGTTDRRILLKRENYFEWLNVLLKMLNEPVLSRY
ncbi:YdbC family protein [Peribacillus frigoritolerans]|uniref:YdbC family protein n=1 Tax=Peribacillus frigoritolerans TaxID=450367 RepID=UPI0021A48CA4|nr:YdbC family protein [Peribacillus frigoritolerans]MCT1389693.1 YdbC family protein [Peribacillus frigoritolerans]